MSLHTVRPRVQERKNEQMKILRHLYRLALITPVVAGYLLVWAVLPGHDPVEAAVLAVTGYAVARACFSAALATSRLIEWATGGSDA